MFIYLDVYKLKINIMRAKLLLTILFLSVVIIGSRAEERDDYLVLELTGIGCCFPFLRQIIKGYNPNKGGKEIVQFVDELLENK